VDLPSAEGRNELWNKTKEAFSYVYKNHFDDADWFLKADDDTCVFAPIHLPGTREIFVLHLSKRLFSFSYVIVENLRYLLADYSPSDPIYFGCNFKKFTKQGYMSGGAGGAMLMYNGDIQSPKS
jgi:glycoprotein-N-acetylgalactosamine 3-beta-galactosyltransferase